MKNIKTTKEVSVDSGQIMALLKTNPEGEFLKLEPGMYKIKLSVKDSWNGPNNSENYLVVKSKQYLCLADGFYKDLDGEKIVETHELYKQGCSLSTGGDGSFKVRIEINKVSKIGPDPYKQLYKQAKTFFKKHEYNDKNKEKFVNKFLQKVHYRKIYDILQNQESKKLRSITKTLEKLLKKHN